MAARREYVRVMRERYRRAVMGKSQAVVHEALQVLLSDWPTEVWGLHSDNGGEFLNAHLVRFCRAQRI